MDNQKSVIEQLKDLAWIIDDLVCEPKVMDRFREMVLSWYQFECECRDAHLAWQKHKNDYMEKVRDSERLRDESAGPPEPEWELRYYVVRPPFEGKSVMGWTPDPWKTADAPVDTFQRKGTCATYASLLEAIEQLPYMEHETNGANLPAMRAFLRDVRSDLSHSLQEVDTVGARAKESPKAEAGSAEPKELIEPIADGPAPPNFLRWHGEQQELGPTLYRLAAFIWKRETVDLDDLRTKVWDPNQEVNDGTIRSTVSRLNKVLMTLNIPLSLSIRSEFLVCTWTNPPK